jgi:hypothetical protein
MTVHKFPGSSSGFAPDGPEPPDNGTEARLAKLEADVGHIQIYISDIKSDVRELRSELRTLSNEIKDSISQAKVWALFLYIGLGGGLLFVMAKGFKWL